MVYEATNGDYLLSTDKTKLQIKQISLLLAQTYWASERAKEVINTSIKNSLCFGLYNNGVQIGFARVVTDYAVFAYLCDVIIFEKHRGNGLGKWLVGEILKYPKLQNIKRWMLATKDAHGLYGKFGWKIIENPNEWMQKLNYNKINS